MNKEEDAKVQKISSFRERAARLLREDAEKLIFMECENIVRMGRIGVTTSIKALKVKIADYEAICDFNAEQFREAHERIKY